MINSELAAKAAALQNEIDSMPPPVVKPDGSRNELIARENKRILGVLVALAQLLWAAMQRLVDREGRGFVIVANQYRDRRGKVQLSPEPWITTQNAEEVAQFGQFISTAGALRILWALGASDQTSEELQRSTGIPLDTLNEEMDRLAKGGAVVQVENDVWRATVEFQRAALALGAVCLFCNYSRQDD